MSKPKQYKDLKEKHKHYRDVKKLYAIEYLKNNPCLDCSEGDIRVLDFDHINPQTKKAGVKYLCGSGSYSLKVVIEEMAKCEVRCANCHRKKTIGQHEWFSDFDNFKARVSNVEEIRNGNKSKHGNRVMYTYGKCRCGLCTKAQREYMGEYRRRIAQE